MYIVEFDQTLNKYYLILSYLNDLPSDFNETTCLTDQMILQTRTGPDLNDPFRSYV